MTRQTGAAPPAGGHAAAPPARVPHPVLLARSLRLAGDALLSFGLLLLVTAAATLAVVGVGLPALRWTIAVLRRHTGRQRATAGLTLGTRIPDPYRAVPDLGLVRQLGTVLADPATWRDLLWLCLDSTAGITLALTPLALWLTVAWHAVLPGVLWAFFPGLRGLIGYAGTAMDGTAPLGYLVVPLAGLLAVVVAVRATGPVVTAHARMARSLLGPRRQASLVRRVDDLTRSRADSLDLHAAEVRRIERDLHDGAQARLVALGMSLGMVDAFLADQPQARELLAEARQNNLRALAELRDLVHGIHPPVLADRGLDGAVRALAIDTRLPVEVDVVLDGRPPAPAESAAYFAIAECVANAARHADPATIAVRIRHGDGVLRLAVTDDGVGGADPGAGTGLAGVRRRLAAFDGTMTVTSPAGGPTTVTMELPCALSSPKTSPSSGTA